MNGMWVDGGIVVAVAGLLAKEAVGLIKRGRNGKGNGKLEGLLNDIKGTSTLTYQKVQAVEKSQAEMTTKVAVIATTVSGFEDRCKMHMDSVAKITDGLKERVDYLDQRTFDLKTGR